MMQFGAFFNGPFQEFSYTLKSPFNSKNVRFRRFSGPYFPAFELNVDQENSEYEQFSCSEIHLALTWESQYKTVNKEVKFTWTGLIELPVTYFI